MSYFDDKETQSPDERDAELFRQLQDLVSHAKAHSNWWSEKLADVDAQSIVDRGSLASLPILNKTDLIDMQEAGSNPLGGLSDVPLSNHKRLFLSPGPIAEPQPNAGDNWRMARAVWAAGIRSEDLVANCFSYHITPAGFMFEEAAGEIGCAVYPGGIGNTETQVQAFRHFNITAYVGTPDFLKIILEKAEAMGTPITSVRKAMVSGGPLFPDLKEWYETRGISVRQCYGTAELGLIGYEAGDKPEGMVIAEDCIVEIVRPGTGNPVAVGEVGEVVVTTFHKEYPLIRFATGDLSMIMDGTSACGRTNARLKGWMGRADQTTKVRGMFVHPRQVNRVIERFPNVGKARLEVTESDGKDTMTLFCETDSGKDDESIADKLMDAIKSECRVRGEVSFVQSGSLPNDGKVIDDKRSAGI